MNKLFINICIIIFLIIINGFFAAAELAVLSANPNRIKRLVEEGNKKAIALEKLKNQENKFLSTIQVGITLAGFFSSATGAANLSEPVGSWLTKQGIPYGYNIAFIAITLILSYITLVLGELFPKRLARRAPEKIALSVARPINILKVIATPFVKLLSASTNLIVKLTRIEANMSRDKVSEDDIKSMLESGVSVGSIETDEQKMIESIFKFNDLDAFDVMTPRVDVFMIDIDANPLTYLDRIILGRYTRIPIFKGSHDNIVGVLHIKDLLARAKKVGFDNIKIKDILRKPYFVNPNMKINVLYKKMQERGTHIAFLMDEFGGFQGIVTLEDIIEEIMGDIYDEYDESQKKIVKVDERTYLIAGSTPIQDINRELDINFNEDDFDYDTIGGLIISILNRLPYENEEIEYQNIILKVQKMNGNRIKQVQLTFKEDSNE
ncbi:MAG TPA: hemolysin family protein [Haloplasmataceae bacterium]